MALSRRFGSINPVGVDSTEEDTDDDDQLLRSLLGRKDRFKYSNPARISFDCRPRDSTESSDEDDRLQEDMAPDWLEEFQNILRNCQTPTETQGRRPLLLDKSSPEICHAPLDALRESVERYQHRDDDDTENQVVPENNDTMLVDDASHRANKGEVPIRKNDNVIIDKSITSKDKEMRLMLDNNFNQDLQNKDSKHTKGNSETTLVQNHLTEKDSKLTKKVKKESESIDKCYKISQEENDSDLSRKTPDAAKTIRKNKNAISNNGEKKTVSTDAEKGDKKVKDTTKEHKIIPKESVDDKKVSEKSNRPEQKDKNVKKEVRFNLEVKSELVKTPVENKTKSFSPKDIKAEEQGKNSSDLKVSDSAKNGLVDSAREAPKHTRNMEDDAKKTEVVNSAKVNSGVCKEKGISLHTTIAKKETLDECSVKNRVAESKPKPSLTLPPYKSEDFKKTKTYNITPASSFPLDELLPVKKKSTSEDSNGKNSSKDQRKRHNTGELVKQQSEVNNSSNVQAVESSEHCGNVFYGTVYDGSDVPDAYPQYQGYTEASSYEAENCKMSHFVNRNLSGIMSAIQSGNPEVISSIQEALYREIGLNLQALAATAKPQTEPIVVQELTATPPLGFYKERSVAEDRPDLPSAEGDNRSGEASVEGKQSEELFHLFVQQCKELVQTKEDKAKLMSLVKVLKNESGNSLTSTGFTPPDADKLHVAETVNDFNSADSEQASPDNMAAGANNLLFEGRTMLKGGVKPRHIPKTTIHKLGKGRPLDPRPFKENLGWEVMYIKLPPFVREMWGEKRLKKILALSETPVQSSSSSTYSCYNPQKELHSRPIAENDEAKIKIDVKTGNSKITCDSKSVEKRDHSKQSRKSFDKKETLSKESISKTSLDQKNSRFGKVIKKNEIEISECKAKMNISSLKTNHNDKRVDSDKRSKSSKQPTLIMIEPLTSKETGDHSKGDKPKRSTSPSGTNRKVISMELDSDSEVEETRGNINRDKSVQPDHKTAGKEFKKSSHHDDNGKEGGDIRFPFGIQRRNKTVDGKVREKSVNADEAVRGKTNYTETNKREMTPVEKIDRKMNYDGTRDRMKSVSMKVNKERIPVDKEIIEKSSVERKQKDRISVDNAIIERRSVERKQKDRISVDNAIIERRSVERKQKDRMSSERIDEKNIKARPSHNSSSHRARHASTSSVDSSSSQVLSEQIAASRSVALPASRNRHHSSIATKFTDGQVREKPPKPAKEPGGSRDRKRHRTTHELQDSESKKRKCTAVPDEKRRYSHGDSRQYSKPSLPSQHETLANSSYLGKVTVSWERGDRLPDFNASGQNYHRSQHRLPDFNASGQNYHRSQHIQESFYDKGGPDNRQNLNSQYIIDLTQSEDSNLKVSACPKKREHKRTRLEEDPAASDISRKVIFREAESACSSSDAKPKKEPKNYILNDNNAKDAGTRTVPKSKKDSKSLEEDRNFLEGFKRRLSGDKVELETTTTVAELKREQEDRLFLQNCKKGVLGKGEKSKMGQVKGQISSGAGAAKAASSASQGAFSHKDMLNLADMEDV